MYHLTPTGRFRSKRHLQNGFTLVEMLPMRYASSRETVLSAEVVEGANTLDFHLEKD